MVTNNFKVLRENLFSILNYLYLMKLLIKREGTIKTFQISKDLGFDFPYRKLLESLVWQKDGVNPQKQDPGNK